MNRNSPPLRRVARYADVWHPTTTIGEVPTVEEIRTGKAMVEEVAGRPIPISVRLHSVGHLPVSSIVDLLAMYREAECIQVAVELGHLERDVFHERAASLIAVARTAQILDKQ